MNQKKVKQDLSAIYLVRNLSQTRVKIKQICFKRGRSHSTLESDILEVLLTFSRLEDM